MKRLPLLLAVVVALSGQTAAPAASPQPLKTLVYQFGYNTKVASSGQGTGTTTITIIGPAADGGMMVSGQDYWWNTARPRAVNTCEVYPNGGVTCADRPYAISNIQVTIFSMLAPGFFKGITKAGTGSWNRTFKINAALIPGASAMAGNQYTFDCNFNFQGKGPIKDAGKLVMVDYTGTIDQEGGHYRSATSKGQIVYDPVAKIPAIVSVVRTHLPQQSVYNNDLVQLKLLKSQ